MNQNIINNITGKMNTVPCGIYIYCLLIDNGYLQQYNYKIGWCEKYNNSETNPKFSLENRILLFLTDNIYNSAGNIELCGLIKVNTSKDILNFHNENSNFCINFKRINSDKVDKEIYIYSDIILFNFEYYAKKNNFEYILYNTIGEPMDIS
jgi:hypothetical protein